MDIFNYNPRHSHEVNIGNRPLGGTPPRRIQRMTPTATTAPEGWVQQCIAIFAAGAD